MEIKKTVYSISFILALVIIISPFSVKKNNYFAYASDSVPTTVEKETLLAVLNVLQNGITETNNEIVLDKEYAKENGLTDQEIHNLEDYLPTISKEDMKSIENESEDLEKNRKQNDIIWIDELTVSATGKHAAAPPSALDKALKTIFITIVGVTFATQIINDMYKLGAVAACHKWGENHPTVKKACKTLEYW